MSKVKVNRTNLKTQIFSFVSEHKYALKLLLMLAIPNLIVLFCVFPGVIHYDFEVSLRAWNMGFEGQPTDDHSFLWQLISYPLLVMSPSWIFYGIFQLALFIFCILFTIKKLQKLNIIGQKGGYIFCAVSAFCPTFLYYNFYYDGEIVYAMIAILITVYLLEIYMTNGNFLLGLKNKIVFAILLFLLVNFKQVGMIPLVLIIIVLLIKYRKKWKQVLIMIAIFALLHGFFIVSTNAIWGTEKNYDLGRDMPSNRTTVVMGQMVARTLIENDNIGNGDLAYFTSYKPLETWKTSYNPKDGIDLGMYIPPTAEGFFHFLHLGLTHPKSYLAGFIDATDLYWTLGQQVQPMYEMVDDSSEICVGDFNGADKTVYNNCSQNWLNSVTYSVQRVESGKFKLVRSVPSKLMTTYDVPIVSDLFRYVLFNTGFPFYVLLLTLIIAVITKKRVLLFIALPTFGTWLALVICSPANWCAMRYAAMMFYSIPLLITLLINHKRIINSRTSDKDFISTKD
jgi:hypothetical protein